MNLFRRLSTRRLVVLFATVVAAASLAGIALAMTRSVARPPHRTLAGAIAHALRARPPAGVTARIRFTNRLVPSGSLGDAASPLVAGASGRLWVSGSGRVRLELQAERGDTELVSDGHTLTLVDAASGTAFRMPLPAHSGSSRELGAHAAPSLAVIQALLAQVRHSADLSGANPGAIGGRPAYTVRVTPRHSGGLLGALALGWDADRGVPLRIALYARGDSSPVLALEVTDIRYGPVPADVFRVSLPPGTHVTTVSASSAPAGHAREGAGASGVRGVARALPFSIHAPESLVGLRRRAVRELRGPDGSRALVVYGSGLGSVVVLEGAATDGVPGPLARLPGVSIGGAPGHELATPLGTLLAWRSGGVAYTLVGSLPSVAAEAAARSLAR